MFTGKGLNLQNTKTEICLWEKYVTKCHFQEKWAHESISHQLDFMRKNSPLYFPISSPYQQLGQINISVSCSVHSSLTTQRGSLGLNSQTKPLLKLGESRRMRNVKMEDCGTRGDLLTDGIGLSGQCHQSRYKKISLPVPEYFGCKLKLF